MRLFFHRNLGRVIQAVLVSSVPAVACGTAGGGDVDASDDVKSAPDVKDAHQELPCNCFDCPIPPVTANATYHQCPIDADADADEGSSDAGSDSDAPSCFSDCTIPCETAIGSGASQCTDWTNPTSPIACTCDWLSEDDAGNVTVQCAISTICGRRLDGLIDMRMDPTPSVLGAVFAKCAWLEAASVRSFRRLSRELTRHGAPRRLVRAARAAARDEIRHARAMTRLARTYGARVPRVEVRDVGERSLEALAFENAVEGCVGETYGALVAGWQALRAQDRPTRETLRVIAVDELRHATLAWRIAAWAEARLDAGTRERVHIARRGAVEQLLQDASHEPPAALVSAAGVPNAHDAKALVRKLFWD